MAPTNSVQSKNAFHYGSQYTTNRHVEDIQLSIPMQSSDWKAANTAFTQVSDRLGYDQPSFNESTIHRESLFEKEVPKVAVLPLAVPEAKALSPAAASRASDECSSTVRDAGGKSS